jgi:hypothetical protein
LTTNKRFVFLLSILAVLFVSVWQVEALSINILNPSFENPVKSDGGWSGTIAGWNISGNAGVFNPTVSHFTGGNVTDGFQTAYVE